MYCIYMYISMHAYHMSVHTYMHTYIHRYLHISYLATYIHTCMHTYIHTYLYTTTYTHIIYSSNQSTKISIFVCIRTYEHGAAYRILRCLDRLPLKESTTPEPLWLAWAQSLLPGSCTGGSFGEALWERGILEWALIYLWGWVAGYVAF